MRPIRKVHIAQLIASWNRINWLPSPRSYEPPERLMHAVHMQNIHNLDLLGYLYLFERKVSNEAASMNVSIRQSCSIIHIG
jgi:hypothetical protein